MEILEKTENASYHSVWNIQGITPDELRMVLGGQPTPRFFYNRFREKEFFTLAVVVNDNEIVRSVSDEVECLPE